MIRIRITDNDTIQYQDKSSKFKKQNRHRSIIKSFKLNNGQIEFSNAELESKIIPKKHLECFVNIPFKKIITDSKHTLFFQDPNNTLQLLKYEDGWIKSVNFDDITEDDDIIIFDDNENEWAITGVTGIYYYNTHYENIEDTGDLSLSMFDGLSKTLSPYMIKLDTGMIVNNILVI